MTNGTGPAGIIGDDAEFSGRMTGADLTVFGRFDGQLQLSGRLKIARQGRVEGTVKTVVVEIEGSFEGEIFAESLVLAETARVKGTFETKRLAIREGAVVEGAFNRGKAAPVIEAAPEAPPAQPQAEVDEGAEEKVEGEDSEEDEAKDE